MSLNCFEDGWTPLTWAITYGLVSMIRALISHGASVFGDASLSGVPMLHFAAENGVSGEALDAIVEAGASWNTVSLKSGSVLHCALRSENLDTVR
jgi:hypothetical protein